MRRNVYMAVAVLVLALSAFVFVLVRAVWLPSGESDITPPQSAIAFFATTSLPAELSIPTLNIRAHVQQVGVTAKGDMGVPTNFTDVGWYKNGVVPGHAGSAVIDGHVDNGLSLAGVFKHLQDIQKGDSIYIEDADKKIIHFIVYDIQVYPYKEVPMGTVFAPTGTANLNIITCEGAWIKSAKTYDRRIVVYSTLAT